MNNDSVFIRTMGCIATLALLAGCGSESDDGNGGDGGSTGTGGNGGSTQLSAFSADRYFVGNDGRSGNSSVASQLWKTDGTDSGTGVVKVVAPGTDADMRDFTRVGDQLFFVADDNEGYGEQLWVSDGTEAGTQRLTDSSDLVDGSANTLTELNGLLYFRARGAGTNTPWIWVSDGTPDGTGLMDDNVVLNNGLKYLTAFDGHLYFAANDGTNGTELWRTDGSSANTELVSNIQSSGLGALHSCPDGFVEFDGMLYFSANEATNECALWRTNGDAGHVEKIKDISSSTNTGPVNMVATEDKLFFLAGGGTTPTSVWVSDGTESGTVKVMEADDDYHVMGTMTGIDYPLVAAGDKVYFHVSDKNKNQFNNLQLWFSEGTISELAYDPELSSVNAEGLEMAAASDRLVFVANRPVNDSDFISTNRGIWATDGDNAEVIHSEITGTNGGGPLLQADGGSTLLFNSRSDVWRTNGTSGGTVFVSEICAGGCMGAGFFGP